MGDGGPGPDKGPRPGLLTAEATLEASGIQDLADQIPELTKAAIGNTLMFNVRVQFEGTDPRDVEVVDRINRLLSEVSDDLRLE